MPNYPTSGGPIRREIPDGDNMSRLVCDTCGYIHYDNPKIVVGSVATWHERILLCRRAIEPQKGFWTLPAGYLELNETAEQGALREAREEAGAEIEIDTLLAVYNIPRISQVQLIYRALLRDDTLSPGEESEEAALFDRADLPWDEIAFPSVLWALRHYMEVRGNPTFAPFTNPVGDVGDLEAGKAALSPPNP